MELDKIKFTAIHSSLFLKDVKDIINNGQYVAHAAVNDIMINTYWNVGRRIVEE